MYKTEKFQRPPLCPQDVCEIDESSINWKWNIVLSAVFQNEAPYLKEFIEFHKLMGVEHFFLYNNMSHDNYYHVLEEYIKKGEVELFEWPVINFVYGQCSCYSDTLRKVQGQSKMVSYR